MKLEEISERIDRIDLRILTLLCKRMELSLNVAKLKKQIIDSNREKQLLARILKRFSTKLDSKFLIKLYTEIFKESKRLQRRNIRVISAHDRKIF